ncbi:MAG: PH domain-containing protein [Clostridia bacterium]|nr:PH domain-containing protein [Clostridia bacterium]
MGKYVEQNLNKNENIVKKAELNPLSLILAWVKGILFFWLLFIPVIKAIIATVKFLHIELAITNKRIVGKTGVFDTKSLDAPLNKIQNVSVSSGFFGKLFNYGDIQITTAAGSYKFFGIKNVDSFKGMVMAQIDQAEEDRIKEQAEQMASAMSSVMKK